MALGARWPSDKSHLDFDEASVSLSTLPPPLIVGSTMAQFKDDEFYMTLVTFQVEDRLFRLPRQSLEAQSPVFKDMFAFPPPPGVDVEGSSDEHPIVLPDVVTVEDFKRLIKVLLPTSYYGTRLPKGDHDGWISVLKLSRMWQMEELQRAALNHLKYSAVRKSAVEKLALASELGIEHWIMPGVNELAQRSQPISIEDAQILGLETALKVAAVRESLVSESLRLRAGSKDAFTPFITKIFNLPVPEVSEVIDPVASLEMS